MTAFLCALSFIAGGAAVIAHGKFRAWQQQGRAMVLHFCDSLTRDGKA